MELGGKSPNVILDDADLAQGGSRRRRQVLPQLRPDLQRPDPDAGAARASSPRPSSSPRQTAEAFTPGDPFDESTRLGPLVSDVQRERVRGYIEKGEAEGAKLVTGGAEPPEGLDRGYFVRPTVFSEVTPEMTIAQEEIFGPVLAIQPYDDEEDAVRIANDTVYGLAGGVWSADPERAIARRQAHPHRPDRDQRRRLQPAGAVRRLQAVGARARERAVRDRGVAAGQVACSCRGRAEETGWPSCGLGFRL